MPQTAEQLATSLMGILYSTVLKTITGAYLT